jgi:hypothetical protein
MVEPAFEMKMLHYCNGCSALGRGGLPGFDCVDRPAASRPLIEHDLFGKPLHTFSDHALIEHDLRANAFRVCREENRYTPLADLA